MRYALSVNGQATAVCVCSDFKSGRWDGGVSGGAVQITCKCVIYVHYVSYS